MILEEEVMEKIKERLDHIEEDVNNVRAWIDKLEKKKIMITVHDGKSRKKVPFEPIKSVSNEEMAFIQEVETIAENRRRDLSEMEQKELFFNNIERSRSEAISKGIAIKNEKEAAIGD